MRPLELLLTLAGVACVVRLTGLPKPLAWPGWLLLLLAAVLLAQLVYEGWRWQMFPIQAVAVVILICAPQLTALSPQVRFLAAIVGLGCLCAGIAACLALPFIEQPKTGGPYAVAVTNVSAELIHRPSYAADDERAAAPLVQLWYPAVPESRWSAWLSRFRSRLPLLLKAIPDPGVIADGALHPGADRLPVILYFPGWPEDRVQNVALIRELASRGYAVASLRYAAPARPMLDYSSAANFNHTVQLDHDRARAHARDGVAVLNALAAMNSSSSGQFARRLNTDDAGLLGFSYGGGNAAEASRLDSRFRAVVNMDGRHWGDALEHGVSRPFMFICEELRMPTADELASPDPVIRYEAQLDQVDYSNLAAHLQANGGIRVNIAGTAHMNFTDDSLRSPLRRLSNGGPIDPARARDIIRDYVVEFFARYLRSAQPPPLDAPLPQTPGVRIQSWPAPGSP